MRAATKVVTKSIPVRVSAADDLGVDRVAVRVNGRTMGVDWTAADGWNVRVPCGLRGVVTVSAWAYDAADNEGSGERRQRLAC